MVVLLVKFYWNFKFKEELSLYQSHKIKNAKLKILICFHFPWMKMIWGRLLIFKTFGYEHQFENPLSYRTRLKTGFSKLLEMNNLINGRSWTEERVRHSKYFPNWNWLTFWTIQMYWRDQWKPLNYRINYRSFTCTVCALQINNIELK